LRIALLHFLLLLLVLNVDKVLRVPEKEEEHQKKEGESDSHRITLAKGRHFRAENRIELIFFKHS